MIVHIINALIAHAPALLHTFAVMRFHGMNVICQLTASHGQLYAGQCSTIS